MSSSFRNCNVGDLEKALKKAGECQVVDVREKPEVLCESVDGVTNLPLSSFEKDMQKLDPRRPVYLLCRTGMRSKDAAGHLERKGFREVYVVEGGIKEWIESGKPVIRSKSKVWGLERQVRFAAGTLVLVGIGLAYAGASYFILISLIVAAGLVFSALTDTCGMALLLVKMPWNKEKKQDRCRH